jgi:hypothetical protein
MTDEQRAIWRRMTGEQRQRVIDARWETIAGRYGTTWGCYDVPGIGCGCPLGIALPETEVGNPGPSMVSTALSDEIDLWTLDQRSGGDMGRFLRIYDAELQAITREARRFADDWDHGHIPPADLIADLRAMQTQEAPHAR